LPAAKRSLRSLLRL